MQLLVHSATLPDMSQMLVLVRQRCDCPLLLAVAQGPAMPAFASLQTRSSYGEGVVEKDQTGLVAALPARQAVCHSVSEHRRMLVPVTLGLSYLPALFTSDHRALHDRLAGTRVVRE